MGLTVLLAAAAVLVPLLLPSAAAAAEPLAVVNERIGELTPAVVQMIAIITAVALLPSLLVMVTSFTKFVVVLSVLRNALGLQQAPPNMVVVGLALFMTLFVMQPTLDRAWGQGLAPYLAGSGEPMDALARTAEPFREFMTANVRDKDLELFETLAAARAAEAAASAQPTPSAAAPPPGAGASPPGSVAAAPGAAADEPERPAFTSLVPAFMTSELRKAFTVAFLLFVPFLVIDMIVSSVLMAMGMMMLPPVVISLPFKLIFFVLVDGWWLLTGSLVRSYA